MKEYIVQAIAQETIDSFDAHNAPELIRCKKCKYFNDYFAECEKNNHTHGAAWYCADGEPLTQEVKHDY